MTTPLRTLPASAYHRLKVATRRLIKLAFGSADAASLETRVSEGHLFKCQNTNPDHATHFLTIDVVADLESHSDYPHVTAALADRAGYVLIPIPPASLPKTAETEQFMKLVSASGTLLSDLSKALEDGKIEKKEIADLALDKETQRLFELAAEMKALLQRIEAGA